MRTFFYIFIIFLFFFFLNIAFAKDVWVNGYYRNDGTYVRGHYRTAPDSNPWNNYSTKGNINPYTGRPGYIDPYKYYSPNSYRYDNSFKFRSYRYHLWDYD